MILRGCKVSISIGTGVWLDRDVTALLVTRIGLTVLLVEQKLQFVHDVADNLHIRDRNRNKVGGGLVNELSDDLVKEYLTV
jgi:ABC-type branched-subunit amino acid transport system ATPase component